MVEIEPRALCILSKFCVAELYLALGSGFAFCIGVVLCCGLLAEAPVDVLWVCSVAKMALLGAGCLNSHLKRL